MCGDRQSEVHSILHLGWSRPGDGAHAGRPLKGVPDSVGSQQQPRPWCGSTTCGRARLLQQEQQRRIQTVLTPAATSMHPACQRTQLHRTTWQMYGSESTESPTSKSPMARDRHRPPGHKRRGPTPIAPFPIAGPDPSNVQNQSLLQSGRLQPLRQVCTVHIAGKQEQDASRMSRLMRTTTRIRKWFPHLRCQRVQPWHRASPAGAAPACVSRLGGHLSAPSLSARVNNCT